MRWLLVGLVSPVAPPGLSCGKNSQGKLGNKGGNLGKEAENLETKCRNVEIKEEKLKAKKTEIKRTSETKSGKPWK